MACYDPNSLTASMSGELSVNLEPGKGLAAGLNGIYIEPIACRAIRSTTVSVAHAVEQVINWNSESYDSTGTMHHNSVDSSRIVIPEDGIYILNAHAKFSATVVASAIHFRKNGTDSLGFTYVPGSATTFGDTLATAVVSLVETDFVEVLFFQSNGGSTAEDLDQTTSYFSVTKIATL